MKTQNQLNNDILTITLLIFDKYPELSKYLDEIPVKIPVNETARNTMNAQISYYNSLCSILNRYVITREEKFLPYSSLHSKTSDTPE
jgi:hypothetical protein